MSESFLLSSGILTQSEGGLSGFLGGDPAIDLALAASGWNINHRKRLGQQCGILQFRLG
jgi:hypothetical protein